MCGARNTLLSYSFFGFAMLAVASLKTPFTRAIKPSPYTVAHSPKQKLNPASVIGY
eukprot:m.74395 g.74395  ORF g.74395 m.74395 type:complete len:56 (+) comp24657_c0_seq1:27-194(+)